ncbi:cache domain-containing protein [Motiliproteus sp.]|uniref:cache domain-containing protein n=1 Tax=Motiliproteus sp. TaxID=1898955 RepID=UPI003BA886FB
MVLGSKLVQRFFLAMVFIIVLFALAIYFYSVPLIKDTVYGIEQNASRTVLNNVYQLAEKIHFGLEGYRQQALESRKQQLKTVVGFAGSYADDLFERVAEGELTEAQARRQLYEGLRSYTYGNKDYIWIASYEAVLLSHPDVRFHGAEAARLEGASGEPIIPTVVARAREQGEAFVQYQWQRLDQPEPLDKLSYVKDFPQWGFVIGSGLYLDDIEAEVQKRLQLAMLELRHSLQEIKIAKTGYMYIFDADANMLIHPNDNLDGINFLGHKNPVTGESIAQELIEVADTGREWTYLWDKPDDPGNYVHQKQSLVRFLEGLEWYIGSSVYEDELQRSSEVLTERIMTITTVVLVISLFVALLFVSQISAPLRRLADTARRVSGGDLSAQSGIEGDDELGVLGRTFDSMVKRLSDNIQNLDYQVQSRTQALVETERRQRTILDELPAQLALVDSELRYHFVNRRYAEMFERPKESLVGKTIQEVMPTPMYELFMPYVEQTLNGRECEFEYSFEHHGREVITRRKLIPEFDENGRVQAILTLSFDMTAAKEAERKLTEAQRMSAVGQLAGGLAHDFNNLLTVVIGNLVSANDRYAQVEGLATYLTPAIRAGRRGADITNRLLSFSRNQPLSPSCVDVGALINDSLALLQGSLPSNIAIGFEADDGPELVAFVDQSQLENALFNLALNARDAMPKGGQLRFMVNNLKVTTCDLGRNAGYDEPVAPGDYLRISVTDSGQGFDQDSLNRAFEPFYTTKKGTGSGLGLSMVYGFVKQSRGYIRIDSKPGQGAKINLLLPARSVDPDTEIPLPEKLEGKHGDGRLILLAEDNADVRAVIVEQLVDCGFAVVEAGDGEEALMLLDSLDELYALVSDIMMPGEIDGYELADRVSLRRPEARIVLITGYAHDQSEREGGRHYRTLRKPFQANELRRALLG